MRQGERAERGEPAERGERAESAERGSGTIAAVGAAGVVLMCLTGGLALASTVHASHRARAVADLAALAAASALQRGMPPAAACGQALQLASSNHAGLRGCVVRDDLSAVVEVSAVITLAVPGLPAEATARARAGPRPWHL